MKNRILGLFAISIFAWGCSTEVELNADWKDTTIVFGLIDPAETLHYVRINKAFLGDGNALTMAMVQDSSEYKNLVAVVEELSGTTVMRSWTLRDTILSDRPTTGIFYAPDYKIYYFTESTLNQQYTYRIRIDIAEQNNKVVTGSTELVQDFTVTPPITFGMASNSIGNNTYYFPAIKWGKSPNGARYEVMLRLKFDEYTATTTTRKILEWSQGAFDPATANMAGLNFIHNVDGEGFYKFIASQVAVDPNVISRRFRAIDMIVYAASEELYTYIQLSSPSNGIVQERPEYTNVDNGLGLFSSRLHVIAVNKYISEFSMEELCLGTYTKIQKDLKFCTDSSVYFSKPYYCP